jgi:hypothetical protein
MGRASARIVAALILTAVAASGCGSSSSGEDRGPPSVRVSRVAGTPFIRVVLSSAAATRIGVRTARVAASTSPTGAREVVVPYDSILYDANGVPSVFTSPDPRVYIRHPVQIDHISGNVAILRKGPAAGEAIVTEGGDELYGAETGVEGE